MKQILVIQFRTNPATIAGEQGAIQRVLEGAAELHFVSALDETLAWKIPEDLLGDADGVILGGSGDLSFHGGLPEGNPAREMSKATLARLIPLFDFIFAHDIPTLGICFGHQILGAFKGAQVVNDIEQSKVGTHTVRVVMDPNDHFLFARLPQEFFAQYGHKDSLDRIPPGATLLMEGDRCKVAALQYQKNIYTVQFHPELSPDEILERAKNYPQYLGGGGVIDEVVKPSPHAEKLLKNFVEMAVK